MAGAILAGAVLYLIASGKAGFDIAGGLGSDGYGAHSPGGYSLLSGFVCELVLTAGFLFVIMGATTNTSVNSARSTGPAVFVGGWALAQLWLFWLAPILGGIAGGLGYRWLMSAEPASAGATAAP